MPSTISPLLDFWGGVPIYDETTIVAEDFSNMLKPRSSAEEVRTFIIKDLDEAIAHLPADWMNQIKDVRHPELQWH